MSEHESKGAATGSLVKDGVTGGSVLAMIISYDVNHSVLYAILHGFCSWGYVIYHLFAH